MPTYEYECSGCGHVFEAFQKMTDKHLEKCPRCGQKIRRLISSGLGIIFKGSGFYATDYRKKPAKEAASEKPACPNANSGCGGCPQVNPK